MKVRQKVTLEIEFEKGKHDGPASYDWAKLVNYKAKRWTLVEVSYGTEEITLEDTKKLLDSMTLASALWWYMEEISNNDPRANGLLFYLRERVRKGE